MIALNLFLVAVIALLAGSSAFNTMRSNALFTRSSLFMSDSDQRGGKLTSPGKNLKPQFDGTFKEAGAHLETYVLEHENGARALVDTHDATCVSFIDKDGVQVIGGKASVHRFPDAKTVLKAEFVPEERAKKVSFDRMIFKSTPEDDKEVEYRVDVTLREDCIEYDVTIKNFGASTKDIAIGLEFDVSAEGKAKGYKVTAKKGYTESTDYSVATSKWTVPVGKFKETNFYTKISK